MVRTLCEISGRLEVLSLSPSGLISFIILVVPILLLLIVGLVWKKARTLLLVLAIVIASGEVYYMLYAQEASLQEWYEHEAVVDAYLEKAYGDDDWGIRRETSPIGYSMDKGYENPKMQE